MTSIISQFWFVWLSWYREKWVGKTIEFIAIRVRVQLEELFLAITESDISIISTTDTDV